MWLPSTSSHAATESHIWYVRLNGFSTGANAVDVVVICVKEYSTKEKGE